MFLEDDTKVETHFFSRFILISKNVLDLLFSHLLSFFFHLNFILPIGWYELFLV